MSTTSPGRATESDSSMQRNTAAPTGSPLLMLADVNDPAAPFTVAPTFTSRPSGRTIWSWLSSHRLPAGQIMTASQSEFVYPSRRHPSTNITTPDIGANGQPSLGSLITAGPDIAEPQSAPNAAGAATDDTESMVVVVVDIGGLEADVASVGPDPPHPVSTRPHTNQTALKSLISDNAMTISQHQVTLIAAASKLDSQAWPKQPGPSTNDS